jgi:hypothetical protein
MGSLLRKQNGSTERVVLTIYSNYVLFLEVTPPHGDTTTVEDHGSDVHWKGGPHYLTIFFRFQKCRRLMGTLLHSGRPWVWCQLGGWSTLFNYFFASRGDSNPWWHCLRRKHWVQRPLKEWTTLFHNFLVFPPHGNTVEEADPGSNVHWQGGQHYLTIFLFFHLMGALSRKQTLGPTSIEKAENTI